MAATSPAIIIKEVAMGIRREEKSIDINEAAEYLGVTAATLRVWIRKGVSIPCSKEGRKWSFKKSELDKWLESGNGQDQQ